MLFALAAVPWLLATGAASFALPHSSICPQVIDDRDEYFEHARDSGMCKTYSKEDNDKRVLVIPGKGVLTNFDVCVAKNEFGQELQDKSGLIFCKGEVILPLT